MAPLEMYLLDLRIDINESRLAKLDAASYCCILISSHQMIIFVTVGDVMLASELV